MVVGQGHLRGRWYHVPVFRPCSVSTTSFESGDGGKTNANGVTYDSFCPKSVRTLEALLLQNKNREQRKYRYSWRWHKNLYGPIANRLREYWIVTEMVVGRRTPWDRKLFFGGYRAIVGNALDSQAMISWLKKARSKTFELALAGSPHIMLVAVKCWTNGSRPPSYKNLQYVLNALFSLSEKYWGESRLFHWVADSEILVRKHLALISWSFWKPPQNDLV